MKRLFVWVLLLLLVMQASSCHKPDPQKTTESTTSAQTNAPISSLPTVEPLPDWTDAQSSAEAFLADTASSIVDCSKREYSYTEMVSDLELLAKAYPAHFSYRSFGKSVAGRDLYVAVLGNPDASQQILVSAGIHGREYLTPLLVMKQMEFYLYYYNVGECNGISYAQLLENCCFYIVPMTNPDGIMLSQAGIDSVTDPQLREQVMSVYYSDFNAEMTSQTDVNEYLKYWKANITGTDLNRNFDALWEEYKPLILRPCHKNYKGACAGSEPETRAMVELTESLSNIQAVLCIHSQGEVLYWNCGQDAELYAATRDFTEMIAARTGYHLIEEQNNDASYSDWCALERGLIAVTVETGLGSCPLFIDKFPTMWFDNFDLLPLSAAYFQK